MATTITSEAINLLKKLLLPLNDLGVKKPLRLIIIEAQVSQSIKEDSAQQNVQTNTELKRGKRIEKEISDQESITLKNNGKLQCMEEFALFENAIKPYLQMLTTQKDSVVAAIAT